MAGRLPTSAAGGAAAHAACIAGSLWVGVAIAACARGPIELGFWIEPVSYSSPRLGAPISSAELVTIESIARDDRQRVRSLRRRQGAIHAAGVDLEPALAGDDVFVMTCFYTDLADWWPLFSPAAHYIEEAEDLLSRLAPLPAPGSATLLELGCGGGSFASHLKHQFKLTLTDISEGMLAQSRALNPGVEHIAGDMRTLRLNRQFDYVLVHDAVCYMVTLDDLRAAIETAAVHCRPGGTAIFLPDYVAETFEPGTEHGGEDAPDGRGFRYLAWHADPDPSDTTYRVDYAFLLKEANGDVRVEHDRHIEGLFPRAVWLAAFGSAGLAAASETDPFGRDVFIARSSPVA